MRIMDKKIEGLNKAFEHIPESINNLTKQRLL